MRNDDMLSYKPPMSDEGWGLFSSRFYEKRAFAYPG